MPALLPFQVAQGLFGNLPGGVMSLLGGGLPAGVMSLLGPQPPPGAAPPGAAGSTPQPAQRQLSPLERATQIGDLMNANAYGTKDQQTLGILGSAGFPLFSDPRMIHGYLGTMAMNGDQDAAEQLRRLLAGGGAGGWGGGEGGMGGGASEASNTGGIA